MKLYLDTEFNGFGGRLISLALVSECGQHEFYEVLDSNTYSGPGIPVELWVQDNVIPKLNKPSVSVATFQSFLSQFLFDVYKAGMCTKFNPIEIVADWPEDITHLTKMLINGPGRRIPSPPLTLVFDPHLPDTSIYSKLPHNALEDARSLANHFTPGPIPA